MIWSLFKRLLKYLFNLIAAYLLSTAPFWILPFINGVLEGGFAGHSLELQSPILVDTILQNHFFAEQLEALAPADSALSIHDTPLPPYHLVQLRQPFEWHKRLGLSRYDSALGLFDVPDQTVRDGDHWMINGDHWRMDTLYRKTEHVGNGTAKAPWHHWVYVSAQPFRAPTIYLDEWDKAFNDLVQYHYATPPAHNAQFHYVSCPGRWFCMVQDLRGPSLLHFTTERQPIDQLHSGSRPEVPGYEPVTVRVIELHCDSLGQLPLFPGVFPSPFNQLRAFTTNDAAWQMYDPYQASFQAMQRLFDIAEEKEDQYPWTYGLLRSLEQKYVKFMGSWIDEVSHAWSRFIGIWMGKYIMYETIWSLIKSMIPRFKMTAPKIAEDEISNSVNEFLSALGIAAQPGYNESQTMPTDTAQDSPLDLEQAILLVQGFMKGMMDSFTSILPASMQDALDELAQGDSEILALYLKSHKDVPQQNPFMDYEEDEYEYS